VSPVLLDKLHDALKQRPQPSPLGVHHAYQYGGGNHAENDGASVWLSRSELDGANEYRHGRVHGEKYEKPRRGDGDDSAPGGNGTRIGESSEMHTLPSARVPQARE